MRIANLNVERRPLSSFHDRHTRSGTRADGGWLRGCYGRWLAGCAGTIQSSLIIIVDPMRVLGAFSCVLLGRHRRAQRELFLLRRRGRGIVACRSGRGAEGSEGIIVGHGCEARGLGDETAGCEAGGAGGGCCWGFEG